MPNGATLEDGPIVIDAALTFEAGTMTTVAATGSLAEGIIPQVLADDPDTERLTPLRSVSRTSASTHPRSTSPSMAATSSCPRSPIPRPPSYLALPGGAYDLEIRPAGTTDVAFDIPEITIQNGVSYTVFAVGGLG